MPIYEYQCPACGHRLERIESIEEKTPPVCVMHPGSYRDVQMERLISVPAHPQFKGSGFYATDYKSSS